MQLQMIKCPKCDNDFPKKRKELGYHVCVNCSTVKPVVGITTVEGTGDHTYNDIIIMDQTQAISIKRKEAELTGKRVDIEMLSFDDEDDSAVSQSIKECFDRITDEDVPDEINYEDIQGIEGIDY